ncbi:hypothetical protein [Microbacterium sp. 2RAF4]
MPTETPPVVSCDTCTATGLGAGGAAVILLGATLLVVARRRSGRK